MSRKLTHYQRLMLIFSVVFLILFCVGAVSAADRVGSSKSDTVMKIMAFGIQQADQEDSTCSGPTTTDLSEGVTTDDVVNSLVGSGVSVSNIVYKGSQNSAGLFSNGMGTFGFDKGVVLSSGDIWYIEGPNELDDVTRNNGLPGDAALGALIPGYTTYDATVLEFDFVPTTSVLEFKYVFASDEYNEYANTNFNDVFGFFVNGEAVSDNVALIPGTATPVAINNVNGGNPFGTNAKNADKYNNNDLSDGGPFYCTEMDGFTDVFTATVKVNPGQTNHIKLAIADAGDHIYDSNVLIEGGSFTAPQLTLEPLTESSCGTTHTVTATLHEAPPVFSLDDGGSAVSGQEITFTVLSGPNAGKSGTALTDENGVATFTYTNTGGAGMDTIQATASGGEISSNLAYMNWLESCNVPEFPTLALPIAMILGFVFIAFWLGLGKNH